MFQAIDDAKDALRRQKQKEFIVNAGLDAAVLNKEKQEEIARRAGDDVDPEMSELAAKMRRDRKHARSKKPIVEEGGGGVEVVTSTGETTSLPVEAVAGVFEKAEKKPKRALKIDWAAE